MPTICPLCFSNQDDSCHRIMSYHIATAASFFFTFSFFPKKFMWIITLHSDKQSCSQTSVLQSLLICTLYIPGGQRNKKNIHSSDAWPTCRHAYRQHLPLHSIISLFRDSRCDSWLFAYQSERAVDQQWRHSLRAAPQRKQRLQKNLPETAISDCLPEWQFY